MTPVSYENDIAILVLVVITFKSKTCHSVMGGCVIILGGFPSQFAFVAIVLDRIVIRMTFNVVHKLCNESCRLMFFHV